MAVHLVQILQHSLATCDDGSCLGIGDTYQGGIIFYLDGNGGGLIAAPSDQSNSAEWGCFGTSVNSGSTTLGYGNINTNVIVSACNTNGIAAEICQNITIGGYSDWFLPCKDELNEMWVTIGQGSVINGIVNIGGFTNYWYWTSSEGSSNESWRQDFQAGGQSSNGPKNSMYNVRAVRAF